MVYIGDILRLSSGYIGVILPLYRDNGKESGNYYDKVYIEVILAFLSRSHPLSSCPAQRILSPRRQQSLCVNFCLMSASSVAVKP